MSIDDVLNTMKENADSTNIEIMKICVDINNMTSSALDYVSESTEENRIKLLEKTARTTSKILLLVKLISSDNEFNTICKKIIKNPNNDVDGDSKGFERGKEHKEKGVEK